MDLSAHRHRTLQLSELAALAGELLDAAGLRPEDGRVSAAPDERTLRYYQTLGLLDRPLGYEGRAANYGYRHLLQAVSVKLLQTRGYSLAQVQAALAGQATDALEAALAALLPSTAPQAPVQLPVTPAARPLLAAEVAPGVTVVLDPRHAADADRLFSRIAALFTSGGLP